MMSVAPAPSPEVQGRRSRLLPTRQTRSGYLLLAPLLLLILLITIFPAFYAYFMSTQQVALSNIDQRHFVGLANYGDELHDNSLWQSVLFSVIFALITSAIEFALGLALALLFGQVGRGRGIAISLLLLPMMVAPALFGIMYRLLLNDFVGILTYYLGLFNISADTLTGTDQIVPLVMVIDVLQWTPFVFIILFTALQSVPQDVLEAARADGANAWQTLRAIQLPYILPAIVVALLVRGVDAFKSFDMIYVLTGGGPGTLTTTASIYIYKMAFDTGDIGHANAAAVLLLLLLTPLLTLTLRYIIRAEGKN
jgi:multiple sugar transport system permease protein